MRLKKQLHKPGREEKEKQQIEKIREHQRVEKNREE